MKRLQNTINNLTTNIALLRAENKGLRNAVNNEKKKQKRGKLLFKELLTQDDCKARFFSPTKIQQARDLQEEKERAKQQLESQKKEERIQKQRQKEEKQREIAQRKQIRLQKQVARQQEQQRVKQQRQEAKEAKEAAQQLHQEQHARKPPKQRQKKPSKALVKPDSEVAVEAEDKVFPLAENASKRPQRQRRLPQHLEGHNITIV